MAGYSVNPAELTSLASQISGQASDLQNTLSAIRSQVGNIGGVWTGEAATGFNELMARWDRDAHDLTNVLNDMVYNLNQAATNYQESDHQISQGFRTA